MAMRPRSWASRFPYPVPESKNGVRVPTTGTERVPHPLFRRTVTEITTGMHTTLTHRLLAPQAGRGRP